MVIHSHPAYVVGRKCNLVKLVTLRPYRSATQNRSRFKSSAWDYDLLLCGAYVSPFKTQPIATVSSETGCILLELIFQPP